MSDNKSEEQQGRRRVTFHDEITFDDGRAVILGRTIQEGEFSSIFVARDARGASSGKKDRPALFALKQVYYGDDNNKKYALEQEVAAHRMFRDHKHIMPLLGIKFSAQACYLLFPYIPLSLSDDIHARRLAQDTLETKRRPFSEREALTIFAGIVNAVQTMHEAGLSHRDIKVENVLLQKCGGEGRGKRRGREIGTPILTDFGSVGPLTVPLLCWADILHVKESAEKHTTFSYCAPELRGGELGYGPSKSLHYGYADVWSLGCLFFAMLYGASPFEIEWRVSLVEGAAAEGTVRFVECTLSKILGQVPFPPDGSAADRRYGDDIKDLIRWILNKVGRERPSTAELVERVRVLLVEKEKENQAGMQHNNSSD